jgi:hypothetical protein
MKVKKTIKYVSLTALAVVALSLLGFFALYFLSSRDPYARLFDSQDLPPGAVNGEWLEILTPWFEIHSPQYAATIEGIEKLAELGIVVRVRVLEERHDTLGNIRSEYYWNHLFSIYAAEVLEVYANQRNFFGEIEYIGERLEFAQIQRIVGRCRERWFDPSFAKPVPSFAPFPPARVPIETGDELILFLSNNRRPFLNPFNGVYRYSPEQSAEGNRVFINVNEHNDLILTEADLLRLREQ